MPKNEVFYISLSHRKSFAIRIVLILLIVLFFSSLHSIKSYNSAKNSGKKTNNKLLSKIKKNQNKKTTVKVKTELTLENIKEIVQVHNDLRNKVAMGKTMKGNSLPQAANMLQVYWSPTIAKGAQEWANRCAMGHSPRGKYQFKGKGLGENIAMRGYSGSSNRSPFDQFVNNWFDEIKIFNSNVAKFDNGASGSGHFTQVIWAESYLIGCGYCKKNTGGMIEEYMVCQYSNQGNFINNPIYQPKNGNECKCPQGYACKNPAYQGLCCPNVFNWCQKDSYLWTE